MSIFGRGRAISLTLSAGAVAALAACGSSGSGTLAAKATTSPKVSHTPSVSLKPSAAPTSATTGTGTGTTTGTGTGTGTTTGTGTGTGSAPSATFTLTGAPSCPSGTNLVHFDGHGATLSWTTTAATGVSLLIDGGLFSSYGPSGSATLPFSCTSAPNTTQTHTYTLQTMGSSQVQRTVSASALVNEITDVGSGGGPSAPVTPSTSASP